MRKARPFLLLGISLVAALGSSSFVYKWLRAQAADARPEIAAAQPDPIELTDVIVAAQEVAWGSRLTREMLTTAKFPTEYVPEGHFTTIDDLEGRVLRMDLVKTEPILEPKLTPVDAEVGGVAAVMDPEKRAMAIRVDDEIGVAGFVKPGDHVDLLVTLGGRGTTESVTKMVLEFTRVLAIGTEMVRVGTDSEPRPVKVITLEVTPEDGEKLALAATQGKFRLALRHPLNKKSTLTQGATVESLLASFRAGSVAPKKKDETTVQLIRGSEATSVTF